MKLALVALGVTALAACGGGGGQTQTDPYAYYRAHNPPGRLVLSRDDAQTRARLGCKMTFAPGTVDAVLHQAYGPTLCKKGTP